MWEQQQSKKEDIFPDAEGWENVDPDDVAKWGMGSEFSASTPEQKEMHSEAAEEMPTGSHHLLSQGLKKKMHFRKPSSFIWFVLHQKTDITRLAFLIDNLFWFSFSIFCHRCFSICR